MFGFRKKGSKKIGLPPGTMVHIGEKKVGRVRISIVDYDESQCHEKIVENVADCFPYKEKPTVTWINVDGVHDVEIIRGIGSHYDLHPLILEDIVNTHQRPKMEDYGDYLFVVLKMVSYDEEVGEIKVEQVSLVLGSNYVLSFQETEGDVFDPLRNRIRNAKGRVRNKGADYLAYALIDSVVDHYFNILEKLGERIESMEEELISSSTPETLQKIHSLKREMIFLRKSIWPLREAVGSLERGETPLIQESTSIFLRDVHDHTFQVIDTVETFRDMLSGMLDTYLSSLSNRMNEVMKVLTIIATIFIPLTFVAGIYGMNFQFMPELTWRWGYFVVIVVMVVISVVMIGYFRKKKWL
jgi:magnesium transporter